MESEYQEPEESQEEIIEEDHVEIYSKNAIRGFSIFFSPLFGGMLLYRNLRVAGYKSGARMVILFSILYTLISILIVSNFINSSGASLAINIIGAFILSDYFFPKYFPDDDYYPKPIWTALGISLLILLVLFLLLYYTGNLPQMSPQGKI
jgi:hypothetical protein